MIPSTRKYKHGELLLEQAERIPPSANRVERSYGNVVNLSEYGSPRNIANATAWEVGQSKYVEIHPGAMLDSEIPIEPGSYKVTVESHYNVLLHGMRVAQFAVRIGECLGLDADQLQDMALAARIHDISITTMEDLLWKPDDFSPEEMVLLKRHPEISVDMIKNMKFDQTYNGQRVLDCVLHHHEHWDGSGYPHGLSGEQISIEPRIVFVADAYDAMTSWRPHQQPLSPGNGQVQRERRIKREPLSPAQALSELQAHAGRRFDPDVVEVFALIMAQSTPDHLLSPHGWVCLY